MPTADTDDTDDFGPQLDLSDMEALLSGAPHGNLTEIAAVQPLAVAGMSTCSGVLAAEAIAYLLTLPSLQANCVVIETLVSLALALGRGHRGPKRSQVAAWFRALSSGPYGRLQDPAEDFFVTRLPTSTGNYRLFEGIWEASRFHVQRFVGVLDALPEGPPWNVLRASTRALLVLSEEVARRSSVEANSTGGEFPLRVLPSGTGLGEPASRQRLRFTPDCLVALGVTAEALGPFILEVADTAGLSDETIGHNRLERRPLIRFGDDLILLLPTAVGAAIRRLVIETCIADGNRSLIEDALASEYCRLFASFPLLGGRPGAPVSFTKVGGVRIAGVLQNVDEGRWINWVFFADDLEGYEDGGLVGVKTQTRRLERVLGNVVLAGQAEASGRPGFSTGITVQVSCGWGRGLAMDQATDQSGWRRLFLSAADLETLSLSPEVTPLSVWRTLDAVRAVRHAGVRLTVPNGFLNLFAWEKALGGALAPHSDLPDGFGHDGREGTVMVPQNGLLAIRAEVARADDARAALNGSGRFIVMRRRKQDLFSEEPKNAHVYQSWADAREGRLVAAYLDGPRPWWLEVEAPHRTPGRILLEHWEMLATWLSRSAPVLEIAFPGLPGGPITWNVRFESLREWASADEAPLDPASAGGLLRVAVDRTTRSVELEVPEAFEGAFRVPENVAEVAMVSALVSGTGGLAGVPLSSADLEKLVAAIIPAGFARHIHFMQADGYRDLVANCFTAHPIVIARQDTALGQIGLAWRARPRGPGHEVAGKGECTALLNDTVTAMEKELCASLGRFARRAMLVRLLGNHESACFQRERWHRTAAANIGLRRDRTDAIATIGEQGILLNAVTLACRILIEAAACECPDTGARPGSLDISRLMDNAMVLFRLGGWSDAIRWNAMTPILKVSALGDIMKAHDFEDDVLRPFGRVLADARTEQGVAGYPGSYGRGEVADGPTAELDEGFLTAFRAEFGVGFGSYMGFLRRLQDIGADRGDAVIETRKSDLVKACTMEESLSETEVSAIMDKFVLRRRPEWRVPPEGYTERDRQPWRFRRRLSLMRRPFVELDGPDDPDPRLLIAPGMVVDGAAYLVRGLLAGEFPHGYAESKAMRSWLGTASNRAGHAFNAEVADRMRALGWEVLTEASLPSLLGHPLDKEYGDVDVLAWNRFSGRTLVMECKDLQLRKTPGEVAEQLADFRGGLDSRQRPDLLLKHRLRCEQLEAGSHALARRLGLGMAPKLEPKLVFRNPVPMQFASMTVQLVLFDNLDTV